MEYCIKIYRYPPVENEDWPVKNLIWKTLFQDSQIQMCFHHLQTEVMLDGRSPRH